MKAFVRSCVCACVCAVVVGGVSWADPDTPDADSLLKSVRRNATAVEGKDVDGVLSGGKAKVSFKMRLRGETIEFHYINGSVTERFDLKFKSSNQDIFVLQNAQLVKLPTSQYGQEILGTGITYEDLSMRFLYWPNGKVLPEDKSSIVNGYDCWVIQLKNPTPNVGQYAWMRVWIGKKEGALWQIDGIGSNGELVKRFVLSSVMKLKDGSWFFKKMRVELRDPNNSTRTKSVSYIDMMNPE